MKIGNRKKILPERDTIKFACHPGVSCFTRCCKDADMYLYPYDIVRMKNRLGIASGTFLEKYTFQAFRDNPFFPSLMLKMEDNAEKTCRFLTDKGCGIYEDRPFSCRAYPLERAVARGGENDKREELYFIVVHAYCLGHKESKTWSVGEWIENQQMELFNDMNDLWVDIDTIFRRNPWGPQGIESPALKMAFMACFNVDEFKSFIFQSSFLSRFKIPEKRIKKIYDSDMELLKFGFEWVKFFLTGSCNRFIV
jgi:Fe-S-cluster containining protein